MKNLVIWGAGGHGRVILDIARAMGTFDQIAFCDDRAAADGELAGAPVLSGSLERIRSLGFTWLVVAIGDNAVRARCFARAIEAGLQPATCIHPTAWISRRAQIGEGTVVMPRVVVQTEARIGVNCILNTGVIVEHDCEVGDHAHLSPSATLCGNVTVGELAHLGAGVTAIPGSRIGAGAVVGAGSVVLREVAADTTVVGVPARILQRK